MALKLNAVAISKTTLVKRKKARKIKITWAIPIGNWLKDKTGNWTATVFGEMFLLQVAECRSEK